MTSQITSDIYGVGKMNHEPEECKPGIHTIHTTKGLISDKLKLGFLPTTVSPVVVANEGILFRGSETNQPTGRTPSPRKKRVNNQGHIQGE